MEIEVLGKGLEYAKKKKKWVLVLGALGLTSYGAYKIYNLPSIVKRRQRLFKLLHALLSVAEMVSHSFEAIGIILKDLKEFLASDSNQIPQSLQQISKLTKSNEFSESLTRITRASTVGILQGYQHELMKNGNGDSGFADRVFDKLVSNAGFASVVVGSFAKNLVMAFYSGWQDDRRSKLGDFSSSDKSSDFISKWIEVACEERCRELIGDCIRVFVTTAVSIYLDKTKNINTFDELFAGLTNPKHEAKVRDMLVSVCNGAVETLIHTSHGIWSTNSIAASKLSKSSYFEDGFDEKKGYLLMEKNRDSGWVSKVSSTLAVPNNRKFVLDMTGVATFETVRSFLEFLLQKTTQCVRRNVNGVNQEVVDKGVEAMRYMSGKSSTVTTLCITLCLNILNSPWILAPY